MSQSPIRIEPSHLGASVFTTEQIKRGNLVLSNMIESDAERNKELQIISTQSYAALNQSVSTVNHSCNPNMRINQREDTNLEFIALRNIEANEELTWDYETNEPRINTPFFCQCGDIRCRKYIDGYDRKILCDIELMNKPHLHSQYNNYDIYRFDSRTLSEFEKFTLARIAYKTTESSYDHMSFSYFYNTLFPIDSLRDILYVCYKNNTLLGYAVLHCFDVKIQEKSRYILMSEVLFDPNTTNKPSVSKLLLLDIAKLKLEFINKEIYIVDTIVTPYFFHSLSSISATIYPSPSYKAPAYYYELIKSLADHYKWSITIHDNAIVRLLDKWKYKAEQRFVKSHPDRVQSIYTEFYKKYCSNYTDGNGVIIMIPVTMSNLAFSLLRLNKFLCSKSR